jgi:Dolichyl-phosphate-mannose-protein mannosyltransferase
MSFLGLLSAIVFLLYLVLPGIRWGLPSAERNRLTFGSDRSQWRAPKLSKDEAEDPWRKYPNYLEGGRERTGSLPRSAFNPIRTYHPDEYAIFKSLSGMRPGELKLNPGFFGWPSCHIYITGAALKAASIVGAAHVVADMDHYYQHPEDMARLYIVGRLLTLFFAIGCVVMVWRASGRLFGPSAGVAAAWVLVMVPVFNVNARWLTADISMLFWIVCVLNMSTHIFHGGGRKWYLLSGIALGLAAGTRYQGALAAFIIVAAHLMRETDADDGAPTPLLKRSLACAKDKSLWLAAVLSVCVFLAVNPYIPLRATQFWSEFRGEFSGSHSAGSWLTNMFLADVGGVGVILCMMWLATLLLFAKLRERSAAFVLMAFGLPTILLSIGNPAMVRYFMPIILIVPLLIAWGYGAFVAKACVLAKPKARLVPPVFMAVVLALAAAQSLSYARLFTDHGRNTRTRAGQWIAGNLPDKTRIGVVNIPWVFELPPINEDRYDLVVIPEGTPPDEMPEVDFFITSDFQFPPLKIRHPLNDSERAFWYPRHFGGSGWRVVERFEGWPPGMGRMLRHGPHDLRYPNPVIVISKPAKAEPQNQ